MRIEDEDFHGLVCLIRLMDGVENHWEMPNAGKVRITGAGMTWLELVPDDGSRVIAVKYFPEDGPGPERHNYPA